MFSVVKIHNVPETMQRYSAQELQLAIKSLTERRIDERSEEAMQKHGTQLAARVEAAVRRIPPVTQQGYNGFRTLPYILMRCPYPSEYIDVVSVISEAGDRLGISKLKVPFEEAVEILGAHLLVASASSRSHGHGDVILLRGDLCSADEYCERLRKLDDLIAGSTQTAIPVG